MLAEDSVELELRRELVTARVVYQSAKEQDGESAMSVYLKRLLEFAARILR